MPGMGGGMPGMGAGMPGFPGFPGGGGGGSSSFSFSSSSSFGGFGGGSASSSFTQTTTTIGANGERITKTVSSKRGSDGQEESAAFIEHTDTRGRTRKKSASNRRRDRGGQQEIHWDGVGIGE